MLNLLTIAGDVHPKRKKTLNRSVRSPSPCTVIYYYNYMIYRSLLWLNKILRRSPEFGADSVLTSHSPQHTTTPPHAEMLHESQRTQTQRNRQGKSQKQAHNHHAGRMIGSSALYAHICSRGSGYLSIFGRSTASAWQRKASRTLPDGGAELNTLAATAKKTATKRGGSGGSGVLTGALFHQARETGGGAH